MLGEFRIRTQIVKLFATRGQKTQENTTSEQNYQKTVHNRRSKTPIAKPIKWTGS